MAVSQRFPPATGVYLGFGINSCMGGV